MPVDVSGSGKKRAVKRSQIDRHGDLELRRARGEIACAECNRLKLRCDKKIPCSSCIRRGCSAICPSSSLSNGQGSRFVLADTEKLHRKILEMTERIRQLEDALAIETAHSPEPHPLLSEELLSIKRGIVPEDTSTDHGDSDQDQDDILDDIATLTIGENGVSRFIGRSGGSESLLIADLNIKEDEIAMQQSMNMPGISETLDGQSPARVSEEEVSRVISQLPPYERGWTLCETYMQQSSWHIRLVERDQLIDELLTPIYKYKNHQASGGKDLQPIEPQELALLLAIFASGALADLTLTPFNDEAAHYYETALATLSFESAAENPSFAVVQTMAILGSYCALSDRAQSVERALHFLNFAGCLAVSIGLYRDPGKWRLDAKTKNRRRQVFWQLFSVQNWQGLASGRPTLFNLKYSDCQFPEDDGQVVDSHGNVEVGFWRWTSLFTRDVLYAVNDITCSPGTIKYSDILELDRKLRDFTIPGHLQIPPGGSNWEIDGPFKIMTRLLPVLWRDMVMLYIHRSYFTRALLDFPDNPFKSQYAASFLCAYRSSLNVLKVAREHYTLNPDFMVRSWMLWKHVFSALVIVGTIVIRGPNSSLAPAALVELTLGVGFFEKSAAQAQWARRALLVLQRLRDKALHSYSQYRCGNMLAVNNIAATVKRDDLWLDELAIFGGRPMSTKKRSGKSTPAPPGYAGPNSGGDAAPILDASEMSTFFTTTSPPPSSDYAATPAHVLPLTPQLSATSQDSAPTHPSPNYSNRPEFSYHTEGYTGLLSEDSHFDMTSSLVQLGASGTDAGQFDADAGMFLPFDASETSRDGTFMAIDSNGMDLGYVGVDEAWSMFLQNSGVLVGSPLQGS